MRILSVAYPDMPVGGSLGGGAEQILATLERGLVERNHRSTVLARHGSRVAGHLIESDSLEEHRHKLQQALGSQAFDLIHFHSFDFHQYLPVCDIPMLATLHLPIDWYPASIFHTSMPHNLKLNCVSRNQAASSPHSRQLPVVPNGIHIEDYVPQKPEPYLFWLGRICPEKGVHLALEVAHHLDQQLIIAGPVHPYPAYLDYFNRQVQPFLDDKRTYIGPVDLAQKKLLLSRAKALLVPSLAAETSSLVSMEALSSGTPVIAFRSGALPEIVDDCKTGFIVDSVAQMTEAVSRLEELSRAHCRDIALERFDSSRMVNNYLALYEQILNRDFLITCAPHRNL